jgi:uncharacterized protein (DUF4415 family)
MRKKDTSKIYGTDIERLRNMKDEDIDFSDIPRTSPEMWAKGIVRKGLKAIPPKQQLTIRLDEEVVVFFKQTGAGYQTRINALLRAYVDAHKTS